MGRYDLLIKPSAVKEIEGVGRKRDHQRIVRLIQSLAEDPWPSNCEKLAHQERYRVRQGRYRIVYTVDEHLKNVLVVKVGHRRDVYR